MNDDLLGYLLQLDDPAVRQRVEERLRSDPELARQLALLTKALAPLAADKDQALPPADLVPRTLGFVAAHIADSGPPTLPLGPAEPAVGELLTRLPPDRLRTLIEVMDRAAAPSRGRRSNVAVAAAVLLLALGILVAAVPYLRHRQTMAACQNRMREFHLAFQTYGDTHEGRFPQVNDAPPNNTASSFLSILSDAGVLPVNGLAGCPSGDPPGEYAYSLGWRDATGRLFGLRREPPQATTDLLPILADRPPPSRDGTPGPDHRYGQNVLFVGGNARFSKDYLAGVNRDNIYRNDDNLIKAGRHRLDTVLGIGYDQP